MKELFLLKCCINQHRNFLDYYLYLYIWDLWGSSFPSCLYVSPPLLEIDQVGGGVKILPLKYPTPVRRKS